MKQLVTRFGALFSVLLLTATAIFPAATAFAVGPNLVANPGFETASSTSSTTPAAWLQGKWGTNTATFTYDTSGYAGSRSGTVKLASYSSGDAKWYFNAVNVTPGATYTFSDWYKSTVATNLDAVVTTTAGTTAYYYVANPAASATWKQQVSSFVAPANAKQVTFFHSISKVGSLSIDDFSLTNNGGTTTPAPTPAPTPVPTAPTVAISAPTASTTVSGKTQTVSANASDAKAVSSVQFKLDGTNLGIADTVAPYSYIWDTTTATNGSHSLTAVATNSSNLTTTSAPASVTVSNVAPTPTPTPTPTPPVTPPATSNLITNSSVETATNNLPNGWASDGWGTNTRAFSYESTGQDGTRSVKTTVSAYTNGDAKWYFNPIKVTAGNTYAYSEWYKSNITSEVDAMVTLKDGSVQYIYLGAPAPATNWTKASYQYVAPANADTITFFHVVAKVGYVQSDNFSFATYTPAQLNRALVSLTFDDGWRSIYTNGLPALKKYGLVSTQYLNSEPIVGGYPDYMTYQMVKDYKTQGSELAWHTRSHADLAKLSATSIGTELNIPAAFLSGIGDTAGTFKNFATPFGSYNATAITEIKKFYGSHRSTDVGYNSKDNFDRYNIKVQNITKTTTPADVQGWINQAATTKTWLVIVYHEVDAGAADPTYAVTPTNLDAELNIVKQSGLAVKTIEQALAEIAPQL